MKLTKGERDFLQHMRNPWWNIINKQTLHILFGTESYKFWHPKGPTGSIVNSLIRKKLVEFAPERGRIGKLVRTAMTNEAREFSDDMIRRRGLPSDVSALLHDLCYDHEGRDRKSYKRRAQAIMTASRTGEKKA